MGDKVMLQVQRTKDKVQSLGKMPPVKRDWVRKPQNWKNVYVASENLEKQQMRSEVAEL